jgi:hypothetical protein
MTSSSTATGESQGPTLVLDDSGDLSKLLHEGIKVNAVVHWFFSSIYMCV